MHIFSHDAAVVGAGAAYLARVAPLYPLFGAGLALYFACQGAGRMAWPFAAGIARLLALLALGAYAAHTLEQLCWVVALGYLLFGGVNVFAMWSGLAWGRVAPARAPEPAR
jgi:MATE family, multidrug efflux pump